VEHTNPKSSKSAPPPQTNNPLLLLPTHHVLDVEQPRLHLRLLVLRRALLLER
jgi:hypothetical protein